MKYDGIRFRTVLPGYSNLPQHIYDSEHLVYRNVNENIPEAPEPLRKSVILTHYTGANLSHNLITVIFVTRILHLINRIPINFFSKK